jgi:hypothetical protein
VAVRHLIGQRRVYLDEVTKDDVMAVTARWRAEGMVAGLIRFRLKCLAEIGIKPARKVLAEEKRQRISC